jgi:hypothetical protein
MAAMPAGCARRSALFTGIVVTAMRVIAIFKDYAANVLRCELLTLFGGRDTGLRSFVMGQGF